MITYVPFVDMRFTLNRLFPLAMLHARIVVPYFGFKTILRWTAIRPCCGNKHNWRSKPKGGKMRHVVYDGLSLLIRLIPTFEESSP
jgi:hypothetical protein